MSNNDKEIEYNRKTNLTYEQFTEAGGILQPIRAIVIKNAKDLSFLFKLCEKIAVTHDRLARRISFTGEMEEAREQWKEFINRSNIVGYFAAEKCDNGIIIGYSYCKPEDWPKFKHNIAQNIAINKHSNKIWAFVNDDPRALCNEKALAKKYQALTRPFDGYAFGYRRSINYLMLGTLMQQFYHFSKRVKKYYKLADVEQCEPTHRGHEIDNRALDSEEK